MARWNFELTTLNGTRIGEMLGVDNRVVSTLVSRLPTMTGSVSLAHPMADDILADDRLILGYRDGTLRFLGEITDLEENAEDGTEVIGFTATSPAWRLQNRLIGKSTAAPHPGIAFGTAGTPVDIGQIAVQIINLANADGGSLTTGVQIGTVQPSSATVLGPVHFKPALEAITELLTSTSAPEVEWKPILPTGAWPNTAVVQFNAYYPRMGQERPNAIFEYGIGKNNVKSYNRKKSKTGLTSRSYVLPESFPTTTSPVMTASDAAAISTRGVHETVVDTDVIYDALRQSLATQHVEIRKHPREVVVWRPLRTADSQPFQDYFLGDSVIARAVVGGRVRYNAWFRVYGMNFTIDKSGAEDVELELLLPVSLS